MSAEVGRARLQIPCELCGAVRLTDAEEFDDSVCPCGNPQRVFGVMFSDTLDVDGLLVACDHEDCDDDLPWVPPGDGEEE